MLSFIKENRRLTFAFVVCIAAALGIFAFIYALLTQITVFQKTPSSPLPHAPADRFQIAEDAKIVQPPPTISLYSFTAEVPFSAIQMLWGIPAAPTRSLSHGTLLYWETDSSQVTVDIPSSALHYRNTAEPVQGAPLASLEEARVYAEEYLKPLLFIAEAQLWPVETLFYKITGAGETESPKESWKDADMVVMSYGLRMDGLPVFPKSSFRGNIYTISFDKYRRVYTLDMFTLASATEFPVEEPVIPLKEVVAAIRAGAVSVVALSEFAAATDPTALQGKTVMIHAIELGYFPDQEKSLMQPVYYLKGTVNYYGREVEVAALYPATVSP